MQCKETPLIASSAATLELCLAHAFGAHRFTAYAPDGDGGRAAEHTFPWRTDSTALALDLTALARAAVSGKPLENDLHVSLQLTRACC